ncbi:uncharacterized protein LOC126777918 isoform X2 [Nymphalis io]|uniref:uncharacterized protein LOC126777918 isoform X2 n=1 Tax=Inachis io TaxID=171585 RepID=UPI002167D578|nr:uncharacterized protein LOC126777918 isoform X2 [Nymphalis io]
MRSVYCLCIIVNLLLLTSDGDAGLAKGIISSIHDTAHKVLDDIHHALNFKEDPKKGTAGVVTVADNKTNDDNKFVATSTAAYIDKELNKEVTGFVITKEEDDTKLNFVSNPTTEATVNFTSIVKEERSDFVGGCSTGYSRTEDGRCKCVFGQKYNNNGEPNEESWEAGSHVDTIDYHEDNVECSEEPTSLLATETTAPELDPDTLYALGEITEEVSKFRPNIHEKLSRLWFPILKNCLNKENKENLVKDYKLSKNCPLL